MSLFTLTWRATFYVGVKSVTFYDYVAFFSYLGGGDAVFDDHATHMSSFTIVFSSATISCDNFPAELFEGEKRLLAGVLGNKLFQRLLWPCCVSVFLLAPDLCFAVSMLTERTGRTHQPRAS